MIKVMKMIWVGGFIGKMGDLVIHEGKMGLSMPKRGIVWILISYSWTSQTHHVKLLYEQVENVVGFLIWKWTGW
jgi:hypothetical protein